ncbi:MAG: CBS domain-containing protein [Acidimicrobiales bacterium]
MNVESILKAKGHKVETIAPRTGIAIAVHKLGTMGIGALVVSTDGERVEGILAEREIVRGLVRHGSRLMDMSVSDVMSKDVPTCSPQDRVQDAMAVMTRSRNRHLPVVADGRLCGLISVGDVVKNRLEEMELEASVRRDAYIAGR